MVWSRPIRGSVAQLALRTEIITHRDLGADWLRFIGKEPGWAEKVLLN